MKQRPLSPYMIGPYYRPQLTSMLSISHRLTGIVLGLIGVPLGLWWLIAVSQGPTGYDSVTAFFSGVPGRVMGFVCLFSLCFHFLNGVRHLIWDSGHMLDIPSAYRAGWAVLVLSVVLSMALFGAMI